MNHYKPTFRGIKQFLANPKCYENKSTWFFHVCSSVCLSVCNNMRTDEWIFLKFDTGVPGSNNRHTRFSFIQIERELRTLSMKTNNARFFEYLERKVKLSLYRPWRPLGLREVEAPTFSDIRLIDGGKVVSPTRRPFFTSRKIPGTHLC
jgi:hypothetical protein